MGNGPLADRRDYVDLADYDREMPEPFDPEWDWREQNQYFQERFCDRLIAELESCSNVLYEMFNEGEWSGRRSATVTNSTTWRSSELVAIIFCYPTRIISRRDDPHTDSKLDVVTLHPKDWVGHFPVFERGFHKTPPKPYLYSEPVPEFDGETPSLDEVRRSVWETALAGAGWVNQNDPSSAGTAAQRLPPKPPPATGPTTSPGTAPAFSIPATCGSGRWNPRASWPAPACVWQMKARNTSSIRHRANRSP